jgi:hypothetical protein
MAAWPGWHQPPAWATAWATALATPRLGRLPLPPSARRRVPRTRRAAVPPPCRSSRRWRARAAGANFAQAGDSARIIDQNLQDQVAGNQPTAGNDQYGYAFWSAVGPSITANSQVLQGLGDGFETLNENLDFTASSYTKANELTPTWPATCTPDNRRDPLIRGSSAVSALKLRSGVNGPGLAKLARGPRRPATSAAGLPWNSLATCVELGA